MAGKNQPRLEIRFGYVLPIFVALGALLNLAITQPPSLHLGRVSGIFIQPGYTANYGPVSPGLSFPGLDPAIIDEARRDQQAAPEPSGALPTSTPVAGVSPSPGVAQPTVNSNDGVLPVVPTVIGAVPTVVGVVPTVIGVVPTVVGVVPTVVGVVPTVVGVIPTVVGVVPTVVGVVPTVINILPTLLPPILPPFFP